MAYWVFVFGGSVARKLGERRGRGVIFAPLFAEHSRMRSITDVHCAQGGFYEDMASFIAIIQRQIFSISGLTCHCTGARGAVLDLDRPLDPKTALEKIHEGSRIPRCYYKHLPGLRGFLIQEMVTAVFSLVSKKLEI